jgi:hypothetical protein
MRSPPVSSLLGAGAGCGCCNELFRSQPFTASLSHPRRISGPSYSDHQCWWWPWLAVEVQTLAVSLHECSGFDWAANLPIVGCHQCTPGLVAGAGCWDDEQHSYGSQPFTALRSCCGSWQFDPCPTLRGPALRRRGDATPGCRVWRPCQQRERRRRRQRRCAFS